MSNDQGLEAALRTLIVDAVREANAPLIAKMDELLAARQEESWLTRSEAAARMRCSPDTVDRMVADGRLRARRLGRAVRIDPSSIAAPSDAQVAALVREARRR